ncbi:hypothetical protein ACGGZK_16660 [Agromyces sp. MMS24-K17]|uniref:hypothetical protein n=1 Tax=Agromyces sp. MMS24-K17 TaxID=3372850 RepID=UPI003754504E
MIAVIALLGALIAPGPGESDAEALDGSQFNAGHIISDGVFYNQGAMTESQIDAFLRMKVPTCRAGYTCLKDYRETTFSRAADARCSSYPGGNQSAATIIYLVSQACGINPQVMITLLEKEQALVSDDWPSARQFRSATGYGCPDTAPCDAEYYGFYNQVYNAAHQFKNYQANPGNWRYQAGRNNTIQWHPNAACGASTVFIENQATAALYIYTPYRPNAAALANLYGTGDGCSAYGNRNFWRIFSDWFGSTLMTADLVLAADSSEVWLVVGTKRVRVPDASALESLRPLFPYQTVARSYIDSLTVAGTYNGMIRDPITSEVFLVDAGARHYVPSCELAGSLGFSCAGVTDLLPSQLAKFPVGAPIGPFVKSAASPLVYYVGSGAKRPVATWAIVTALNARVSPHVVAIPDARLASFRTGAPVLGPGSLVKSALSPQIFLVDGTAARIPVGSFDVAAELGSRGWTTEVDSTLASYPVRAGILSTILDCAGATYIGGNGQLTRLTQAASSGLQITAADPMTCGALPRNGLTQDGPLFAKSALAPDVYMISGGVARPIDAMDTLIVLNANRSPVIVTMGVPALSAIPRGAPLLKPGALVKSAASPQVYMVDGTSRLVPVGSFGVAAELGSSGYSTQSNERLAGYTPSSDLLRIVLRCGPSGAFVIGGQGMIWRIADPGGLGLAATLLDPLTCGALPASPTSTPGAFFAKDPNLATVFQLRDGQKRPVTSWDRLLVLNGGAQPTIVPISGPSLATIPTGPPV